MAKTDLTPERLREILHYDPGTGLFTWLIAKQGVKCDFSAGTKCRRGYVTICIENRRHYAHRLAWLYMTGEWPSQVIDHINKIKHDNKFENLRDASFSANSRNSIRIENCRGTRKNNGFTWGSRACINKKSVHLGNYLTEESARVAYNKVNALFPDVSSMLKMAFELRKEAAAVIEKTRFRLNVDGQQMNMRDASIHLGVPLRTVYSRLHGGRYLAAQI